MQIKKYRGKYLLLLLLSAVFTLTTSLSAIAKSSIKLPQWHNIQLPKQASLRGSAIMGNSLWVSGTNNTVFVSQDGGKTWQDKSPQLPLAITLNTDYRDIALFNNNTAIIMGVGSAEKSVLFKTIDGGDTWQLLYQNTDKQGFFDSIAFWNEQQGLLLGDPVEGYYLIKKTLDGGKTWQRVAKTSLPKKLKNEGAFAASGNTLIVGKNFIIGKEKQAWITTGGLSASIYISKDAGKSWQRQAIPLYKNTTTAGGYALALNNSDANGQQIFALGGDYKQREKSYPNITIYADKHWLKSKSGQHGLRTAMSCLQNICIATGKTSSDISFDDGITWQILPNVNKPNSNKPNNEQGFYTLAADNSLFLAAGEKGKVAILKIFKTNM